MSVEIAVDIFFKDFRDFLNRTFW